MVPAGGLGAAELAALLRELAPQLRGARVRDLCRLKGRDDLILFLDTEPEGRCALQIAPGGPRARVCTTSRRFGRHLFETGPLVDRLAQRLRGARLVDLVAEPGQRSCCFDWQPTEGGLLRLQVELFGARGLWCLCEEAGQILELSRLPNSKDRALRPGQPYQPPPAGRPAREQPPRFRPPLAPAIDRYYSALDLDAEEGQLRRELQQTLDRGRKRCAHKIQGLERQQETARGAEQIRQQADLLLAYGFGAAPGQESLRVPDPQDPEAEIELRLEPGVPVQKQADKLYQRARKLQDGTAVTAQRLQESRAEAQRLDELAAALQAAEQFNDLVALRPLWIDQGLLKETRAPTPKQKQGKDQRYAKLTKGLNLRLFESVEGHLLMVGRNNQQNDRLSVSVARGNDYWFHVGQGYAGSHVVLRIPKEKTPSLDSLLDAATLAIYFSKARQAHRCEVIYCRARHVRKPKGFPPGKVTTTQTKTLLVDMEDQRLRRLLDHPLHGGGES